MNYRCGSAGAVQGTGTASTQCPDSSFPARQSGQGLRDSGPAVPELTHYLPASIEKRHELGNGETRVPPYLPTLRTPVLSPATMSPPARRSGQDLNIDLRKVTHYIADTGPSVTPRSDVKISATAARLLTRPRTEVAAQSVSLRGEPPRINQR